MTDLPLATHLICEAARELGWKVEILDPEFGYLFEVQTPTARRRFLGGRSPLNDAVAARLAEDKHYSAMLLARAGLRVPQTVRCLRPFGPELAQFRDKAGAGPGHELAARVGYPVVVKPNRLSHGRGVRLAEEGELEEALDEAWALDTIALVQERARGRDVRLDFVDGELIAGYERRPLEVEGDGERTLLELAAEFDARFATPELLLKDARLTEQLAGRGLDWVPARGERFAVEASILNLNGAASANVVREVDEEMRQRCVRAGEAVGLRHFGVDLKIGEGEPVFIEINASPLVSQMYRMGFTAEALGAQRRVLKAIFDV